MLPWIDYKFHVIHPGTIEVVDESERYSPHVVVRFLDVPGVGTVTALVCWTQFNRGQGVGGNTEALNHFRRSPYDGWVYLLRYPTRGFGIPKRFSDVVANLLGKSPKSKTGIQGRLVKLSDLDLCLASKDPYKNKLRRVELADRERVEKTETMRYIEPDDFNPNPLNSAR